MKTFLLAMVASASLLAGCQSAKQADIDRLKVDVAALKANAAKPAPRPPANRDAEITRMRAEIQTLKSNNAVLLRTNRFLLRTNK